jgi:hypothetical protein
MADEEQFGPEDLALFEAEVERLRKQELPRAREEEIKAAAQRAVERDLESERESYREELDTEVARATTESIAEERAEARREAPSKVLMLAILLILLVFILAATGQLRSLFGGAARDNEARLAPKGAFSPALDGPTTTPVGSLSAQFGDEGDPNAGGVDAPGAIPAPVVEGVDPLFATFYAEHDGLRLFGLPLSELEIVNGREVQWFERDRLEHWPEYGDTPYAIQPGLVGREYTDGRLFPAQTFFTSRPGLVFFPETSHGLGGPFLEFWTVHGGVDTFGYPISDELPEVLEDGRIRNVQYFERARLELHPADESSSDQVLVGLLGRALYLQEPRPEPLPAPAPTPVPLP